MFEQSHLRLLRQLLQLSRRSRQRLLKCGIIERYKLNVGLNRLTVWIDVIFLLVLANLVPVGIIFLEIFIVDFGKALKDLIFPKLLSDRLTIFQSRLIFTVVIVLVLLEIFFFSSFVIIWKRQTGCVSWEIRQFNLISLTLCRWPEMNLIENWEDAHNDQKHGREWRWLWLFADF